MFQNWGFLITEIFILLLLAALLGLFCGWLIWGGRCKNCKSGHIENNTSHNSSAKAKISDASDEGSPSINAASASSAGNKLNVASASVAASANAVATKGRDLTKEEAANVDFDSDGKIEGLNEGIKPATLDKPRNDKADDLKDIIGVGPKLEKLLHSLGFFHFDQIANWTNDEQAWVDANLEGFHGRATREEWVKQAKILAAGGKVS